MADGKVVIETDVDSSGAEKSLGKLSKGIGTALKGTAVAIGSTATAIGVLGTQSVKLYSDYEQLAGGVETLFGTGGKTVEEYAKSVGKSVSSVREEYANLEKAEKQVLENASNAYKDAGMSANEYMNTVTSFSASLISSLDGDTVKASSYANQAIIDMADNANKMGSSMESIQNAYQGFAKQNYTMLDNLKLGYGGTKQEMQRLLSDAEKLTGKKYDISNFGDITQAIHAIQEEMGIAGATSDEAATTIQGSVGMMKSAWENFLTGMSDPNQDFDMLVGNLIDSIVVVGDNLVPRIQMMLPRLIEGLVSLVNSLIPQIPSILQTLLPALFNGATSLLSSILQIAPQLLQLALELIVQFAQGITQATPQAINTMIECVFGLIDSVLDNLPLVLEAGLEMLFALGDGLIEAIPNVIDRLPEIIESIISTLVSLFPLIIDTGVKLLTSLTENMPLIITSICNAIPIIIESIVSSVESLVPLLVDAGVKLFVALVQNLPLIIATSYMAVGKIITAILSSLMDALPRLHKAGFDLLIGIVGKIGEACKWIGDKMKTIVNAMKEAITKKIKEFTTIGKNIVEGVWNGIKGMKDTITKNVKNFFGGIVDSAKEKLGIHSPSRVFEKIVGENIALGVIKGMKNKYKKVKKSASEMASLIYESAKTRFDYYTKYNDMSLSNEVAYWKKIVNQTKKGTQGYKDAMLEYKNAKSELDKQVIKLDEDYASGVAKVKDDLIKNIQAITDEYEKSVESRKNAILNSMDIFKAFESTTENTSESLITNLEGQVDALAEWDAILDSLEGKGLSSAIIGDLQEMGVSQLADLRLLNEMTEEQLLQFASLYEQKNILASERAVQELAGMRQEAETEIRELIKDANAELDRLEADYMKGLAEIGVKTTDKSKSIGKDIVNGLKDGIKSQQAELQSFLSSFFNSIMSSAKASLSVSAPQIANTVLAGATNGVSASSTVNNNNQVVNVYQQVSTPDELAKAVRLETRYA